LHPPAVVPQAPVVGGHLAGPGHLPPPGQALPGPAPDGVPPAGPGPDTPRECAKRALSPYIIEPPDILLVQASEAITLPKTQPIAGTHLVRPDGTIGLGVYGSVFVAGLTLEQARDAIAAQIQQRVPNFSVEKIRRE